MIPKVLVTCVGRRVELIRWMDAEFRQNGIDLYVHDQDNTAPAFQFGKRVADVDFQQYTHVMTLIDTQLKRLAVLKRQMKDEQLKYLVSDHYACANTLDKMAFYENFKGILNIPQTAIVKNRQGSASQGVEKVIQPYIQGQEHNVQAYFDFITGKLVTVFMQEKILMRAGETERGRSVWVPEILEQVKKLEGLGFYGPIDMDIIMAEGVAYVLDINPRFGGGYQMAHYCGVDFVKLLMANIWGQANVPLQVQYETGRVFSKYDTMMEIL